MASPEEGRAHYQLKPGKDKRDSFDGAILQSKVKSEEGAIKLLRMEGERSDRQMGFVLVGILVLLGLIAICIPGVNGMEFAKTIILPAITGVLGFTLSSKRSET